jgi:hypothetical protein
MKNMHKKLILVLALAVALALMISPVYAKGNSGQAGNSNVAHLYLDPYGNNPLEPDAWGKVKYNFSGETLDFVFNGHQLTVGQYYGMYSKGQLLGVGMANEFGDVHIKGSFGSCELVENGRFNLWTVTVVLDEELTVTHKLERILWTGPDFNEFSCSEDSVVEE